MTPAEASIATTSTMDPSLTTTSISPEVSPTDEDSPIDYYITPSTDDPILILNSTFNLMPDTADFQSCLAAYMSMLRHPLAGYG